jgi:hypothetical protein
MTIEEVDLARRETQKINELTENSRLREMKLRILTFRCTHGRVENIAGNGLIQFKKLLSEILADAGL